MEIPFSRFGASVIQRTRQRGTTGVLKVTSTCARQADGCRVSGSVVQAAGAVRQARQTRAGRAADLAGDAGGNGRHHAIARECLHEEIPAAGIYRLHGRAQGQQLAAHRRLTTNVLFACYSGIPSLATSWARSPLKATSPATDPVRHRRDGRRVPSTGRASLSERRPPGGRPRPWPTSLATRATGTARTRRATRE